MAYFNRGNRSGEKRNFGKPRFERSSSELYKVICANCGKNCEVPFKPNGSKPVLCRDCFKNNGVTDSRGFGNRADRKMYDAVCSNCGMNCKIPFRPTEGREVLCSNCFEKNGPIDTRKPFEKQNFNRNDRSQKTNDGPNYQVQFDAINAKMDKILDILNSAIAESPLEEPAIDEFDEEITEEKKEKIVATPKKTTKKNNLSKREIIQ